MNDRVRLLADEDMDQDIVRGVLNRIPDLDIVLSQSVGLGGKHDKHVLEWAAQHNRILVTHDVRTMPGHAYARVLNGLAMPGVFTISQSVSMADAIESLLLIAECSNHGEWTGQVRRLPL